MTDKPALNVVQIHDGRPPLSDIVGRLRHLADMIESNELTDVHGALVIIPTVDAFPRVFGYGDVEGANNPIAICEMAKAYFVSMLTNRSP